MKKLLIALLFSTFIISSLFAQNATDDENEFQGFTKGNFVITGGISYNSFKENENLKDNRFSFVPKIGYFVSDNVTIGITAGFSTRKREGGFVSDEGTIFLSDQEFVTNTFSIGTFGRYYFMPTDKFSIFTELSLNYFSDKDEIQSSFSSFKTKSNGFRGSFSPGASYFLSDSFVLEASFGLVSYSTRKRDAPIAEPVENFNVGLNLSNINLGLVYRF